VLLLFLVFVSLGAASDSLRHGPHQHGVFFLTLFISFKLLWIVRSSAATWCGAMHNKKEARTLKESKIKRKKERNKSRVASHQIGQ
jgi:hypothetical protein